MPSSIPWQTGDECVWQKEFSLFHRSLICLFLLERLLPSLGYLFKSNSAQIENIFLNFKAKVELSFTKQVHLMFPVSFIFFL